MGVNLTVKLPIWHAQFTILCNSIGKRDTVAGDASGVEDGNRVLVILRPANNGGNDVSEGPMLRDKNTTLTYIANLPHCKSIMGSFNWHSIITSVGDWLPVT